MQTKSYDMNCELIWFIRGVRNYPGISYTALWKSWNHCWKFKISQVWNLKKQSKYLYILVHFHLRVYHVSYIHVRTCPQAATLKQSAQMSVLKAMQLAVHLSGNRFSVWVYVMIFTDSKESKCHRPTSCRLSFTWNLCLTLYLDLQMHAGDDCSYDYLNYLVCQLFYGLKSIDIYYHTHLVLMTIPHDHENKPPFNSKCGLDWRMSYMYNDVLTLKLNFIPQQNRCLGPLKWGYQLLNMTGNFLGGKQWRRRGEGGWDSLYKYYA